jgi:hypothetical protein
MIWVSLIYSFGLGDMSRFLAIFDRYFLAFFRLFLTFFGGVLAFDDVVGYQVESRG